MGAAGKILYALNNGVCLLEFVGEVRLNMYCSMDRLFGVVLRAPDLKTIVLDVTEASQLDSTVLGMMARLARASHEQLGHQPTLVSNNPGMDRLMTSMGLDDVFHLQSEHAVADAALSELPCEEGDEEETRRGVIAAHRALMALNDTNRAAFADLVEALEAAGDG